VKDPVALRLHPAMEEMGIDILIPDGQNDSEDPVLITQAGLILSGFKRWQIAVVHKLSGLNCIEHELADADALRFILALKNQQRGWNAFIRIRLALRLEAGLQERAQENMKMGGKQKGLAILPKAAQIDVRQEIAEVARVGERNVSKVKQILASAHSRIIEELSCGYLSINQDHVLSQLPRAQQVEQLANKFCDRALRQIEQNLLTGAKGAIVLDANPILKMLQQFELDHPGSVSIRAGGNKRTVVTLGEDLQALIVEGLPSLPL
jgi:hypothetical protein